MTTSDLLPCPFCGGEASFGEDECVHDVIFAFCTRCAAQGPFDADKDREEAATLWNTRTPPPADSGVVEALRRIALFEPVMGEGPPHTQIAVFAKQEAHAALAKGKQP